MNLPPDIPAEAVPVLERAGYFEPDHLRVGAAAPDLPVYSLAGEEARLAAVWAAQPAVLIFGSYT